jgi:tetratricopeptide (TPR) repeat protein
MQDSLPGGDFLLLIIILVFGCIAGITFLIFNNWVKKGYLFTNIENALKVKNHKMVVDLCLRYLKSKPPHALVYYYMAKGYEGLGQFIPAIANYEKALVQIEEWEKQGLRVEIFLKLGTLYSEQKKLEQAIGYYRMILQKLPSHKEAIWRITEIYFEAKKFSQARTNLEKLVSLDPSLAKAHLLLSKVYHIMGDFQKSILQLEKFFDFTETVSLAVNKEISLLLADNYLALKKYKEAFNALKPLLSEKDLSGTVLLKCASALLKSGEFYQALNLTDDFLYRIPVEQRSGVLYNIGHICKTEGEIFRALETWKTASSINPKYLDLAEILENYRVLIENPWLENIFTSEEEIFEKYVRKKFNLTLDKDVVEKRNEFWLFKRELLMLIVFRLSSVIDTKALDEIENTLKEQNMIHFSIILYALFGVDENASKSPFFRKIKEVSGKEFITFFSQP